MKRLSFFGLMAIVLVFAACKKGDAGPAGAAGANGSTGANGANGATGNTGAKGDTGVANVIYSAWIDVGFDTVDVNTLEGDINAPALTDSILKTGEIKLYLNLLNADTLAVTPVPYQFVEDGFLYDIKPIFLKGGIAIIGNFDASTFFAYGRKRWQYRYVLIPGAVKTNRAISINWNDYKAVAAYLHLKD